MSNIHVEHGERNVDIMKESVYQKAQNEAANAYVHETGGWDSSAEALALKQAFVLGSNTSKQFDQRHVRIVQAVIAGRKWGLAPKGMSADPGYLTERGRKARHVQPMGNRRMVVIGRKRPEYHTMDERVDNNSPFAAEDAGLPPWKPYPASGHASIDQDERRKQRIEDAIVRGDDL